jgi:tRNA G18 (ribose-2'-O)-methylase SpoU
MRGYFGIGVERLSKQQNAGSIFRTAHAFDASFVFSINSDYDKDTRKVDTSKTPESLPYYRFDEINDIMLPRECKIVGVELIEDSIDLPGFRHPRCAAYILGPERDSLSPRAD